MCAKVIGFFIFLVCLIRFEYNCTNSNDSLKRYMQLRRLCLIGQKTQATGTTRARGMPQKSRKLSAPLQSAWPCPTTRTIIIIANIFKIGMGLGRRSRRVQSGRALMPKGRRRGSFFLPLMKFSVDCLPYNLPGCLAFIAACLRNCPPACLLACLSACLQI